MEVLVAEMVAAEVVVAEGLLLTAMDKFDMIDSCNLYMYIK